MQWQRQFENTLGSTKTSGSSPQSNRLILDTYPINLYKHFIKYYNIFEKAFEQQTDMQ